jgi:hypothetical protein
MICELIDERLRAIKGNTEAKIEGDTSFINPIRGCLFFGVPHEGSASAASFYPLLKLLDGIIPFGGGPSTRIVRDLRPQSDKLPEIQDRFGGYRGEFGIEVMSCWETQQLSGRTVSQIKLQCITKAHHLADCHETVGDLGISLSAPRLCRQRDPYGYGSCRE